MSKFIHCAVMCVAVLVAPAGPVQAAIVITYQDVGTDLVFHYTGTLDVAIGGESTVAYATASYQVSSPYVSPVFYSTGTATRWGFAATYNSPLHTEGPYATNLPLWTEPYVDGTTEGTGFMFRLNQLGPNGADSINIWGDWGAANSWIEGRLTLFDQSVETLGLIDGWQIQTPAGSITFVADTTAAPIPEPTSLAIWSAIALGGLGLAYRRRKRAA